MLPASSSPDAGTDDDYLAPGVPPPQLQSNWNGFPGSWVAVVTGVAGLIGDVGVVIITIHVGADAVAIGVANAGAGSRRAGQCCNWRQ